MNTVKQDRKELRRLVESYGINDVVKFVNAMNEEEQLGSGKKEEILNKYFNKVYSILSKTSNSAGVNKIFTQLPFAKGVIIDSIFGPLYDKGLEAYTKMDEMPNFKMYMLQVTNTYMMRFITNITSWLNNHFNIPNDGKYSYELRSNTSFRYLFVEIFKAAMSEAKQESEARETQAQEDADIQAGLDAKPGNFAEFDTSNQRAYLLSQINTYTQTVAESKNAHLTKATKDCLIIKSNYPEIGYVYLRPDGAWFYKDESGSVHAYRLTEGALKYFRVKDAKGANFIAEWCKLFMVDQKYIDKREWRVDANAPETWLEK